jgi:hypothetical protein
MLQSHLYQMKILQLTDETHLLPSHFDSILPTF